MSVKTGRIVKVTFKLERERWRVTALQVPEGAKEPVVVFRAKHASLGDAMDGFDNWMVARAVNEGRAMA